MSDLALIEAFLFLPVIAPAVRVAGLGKWRRVLVIFSSLSPGPRKCWPIHRPFCLSTGSYSVGAGGACLRVW